MAIERRVVVDHVGITVSDLERSRVFYRAALEPLGFTELVVRADTVGFGADGVDDFYLRVGRSR